MLVRGGVLWGGGKGDTTSPNNDSGLTASATTIVVDDNSNWSNGPQAADAPGSVKLTGRNGGVAKVIFDFPDGPTAGKKYTISYTADWALLNNLGKDVTIGFGLLDTDTDDFYVMGLCGHGDTTLEVEEMAGTADFSATKQKSNYTVTTGSTATNGTLAGENFLQIAFAADGTTATFRTSGDDPGDGSGNYDDELATQSMGNISNVSAVDRFGVFLFIPNSDKGDFTVNLKYYAEANDVLTVDSFDELASTGNGSNYTFTDDGAELFTMAGTGTPTNPLRVMAYQTVSGGNKTIKCRVDSAPRLHDNGGPALFFRDSSTGAWMAVQIGGDEVLSSSVGAAKISHATDFSATSLTAGDDVMTAAYNNQRWFAAEIKSDGSVDLYESPDGGSSWCLQKNIPVGAGPVASAVDQIGFGLAPATTQLLDVDFFQPRIGEAITDDTAAISDAYDADQYYIHSNATALANGTITFNASSIQFAVNSSVAAGWKIGIVPKNWADFASQSVTFRVASTTSSFLGTGNQYVGAFLHVAARSDFEAGTLANRSGTLRGWRVANDGWDTDATYTSTNLGVFSDSSIPIWVGVRFNSAGNTVEVFESADGVTWTTAGTQALSLNPVAGAAGNVFGLFVGQVAGAGVAEDVTIDNITWGATLP